MPDPVSNEASSQRKSSSGATGAKRRGGHNDRPAEDGGNDATEAVHGADDEQGKPQASTAAAYQDKAVSRSLLEEIANKAADTGQLDLTKVGTPVATADIATSAQDFHSAATVLASVQMPYPMVHISAIGWAPLDLLNSVPADRPPFASPADIVDYARRAPEEVGRTNMLFNTRPVPQARRSFATLLVDFLRVRLETASGLRPLSGEEGIRRGTPEVPGLDVTVHNRQRGLRIHCIRAYFPETRRAFGNSLSTPVRGYLPPGNYIFGADGPTLPLVIDDTVYEIPPSYTIHMIRL